MVLSLRENLKKIGEFSSTEYFSLLNNYYSIPTSLRDIIHAMESPRVEEGRNISEKEYRNEDWSEEAQGLTNDGEFWYFSSNNGNKGSTASPNWEKRGIYKFTFDMKFVSFYKFTLQAGHLGDIDYYNGLIYC